MKKKQKGFSLIMAIMISVVLLIMAMGFLALVGNTQRATSTNIDNLKLYWMAESASNYNVRWWVNQSDSTRKRFDVPYIVGNETYDETSKQFSTSLFPKSENMAVNDIVYLHPSTLLFGNTENEILELNTEDYTLYNARYKGARKGFPTQAVWILDSYAKDNKTGQSVNICLSNVYNYLLEGELEPFINSELINATLAGAGFHGVKGRFNEQDTRYGQCYFNGLVHFDYITGSGKIGPVFYGKIKSAADQTSWYKNDGNLFNPTHDYGLGLGINSAKVSNQAEAVTLANTSLLGGYEKNVKELNLDNVVWTWEDVVKYGAQNKTYFIGSEFAVGSAVGVKIETYFVSGQARTRAKLYNGSSLIKTIEIGDYSGAYKGIAVSAKYGTVSLQGVSANDFTLVTEKDQVLITDNFYLYEMEATKNYLNSQFTSLLEKPTFALLTKIWQDMITYDPKGHLAVIACLGMTEAEFVKTVPPIYFPNEKLIFSTTAYITKFGELSAKGVGGTNLNLINIGPTMVLNQQEIMSGPSDTAQKWPKTFVQDQRYLRPDEPLPPMCGSGPGDHPNEDPNGLNRNHRWSTTTFGKINDWNDVIRK